MNEAEGIKMLEKSQKLNSWLNERYFYNSSRRSKGKIVKALSSIKGKDISTVITALNNNYINFKDIELILFQTFFAENITSNPIIFETIKHKL